MSEPVESPARRQERKRRRLVVAALREQLEGLVAEDVEPDVDPVRQARRLPEPGHDVVVVEVHDPELGPERHQGDSRGRLPLAVPVEERVQVDVQELVTVHREHRPLLTPSLRCEAKPAAATERLRLLDDHDLWPDPGELPLEQLARPGSGRNDDPIDAGPREESEGVRRERATADRDERLGQTACGVAKALGLAAGEQDRFHYLAGAGSSSLSGRPANGELGLPTPSWT